MAGNRLTGETSPYLLQHASNPVDWFPWGTEARELALKLDRPIFLSLGYSTCYWCHVMEAQSFEDDEVARVLNDGFVAVKVDREERPDLDDLYMLATELVAGRGGWPNSVWLTPDGRPFMAGTYFPTDHFLHVLDAVSRAWRDRRDEVEESASDLTEAIQAATSGEAARHRSAAALSLHDLLRTFDEGHGGFGGAPKFPPHDALRLLTKELRTTRDERLLRILEGTLDGMWRGGIHDHLGGGFHRYATDREWLVPHFEKMLYDNAQLIRAYADGFALTGRPHYRRAVEETVSWLEREMTSPEGAFYTAQDAGEMGKEGEYYTWRLEEVLEALGEEEGRFAANAYGVRDGVNILHLKKIPDEEGEEERRLAKARRRLQELRGRRERPRTDTKVLAGWNGLTLGALAHAGTVLGESRYVTRALRAAEALMTSHLSPEGRLLRSFCGGRATVPGFLDDHAYLADGLLDLHEATGDGRWLDEARRLAAAMTEGFRDPTLDGFYSTAPWHEGLLVRSRSLPGGGNLPHAGTVADEVLRRLEGF